MDKLASLPGHDARDLLLLAPALSCIADANTGRFLWLSSAWSRLLGWTEEELLAEPFLNWVHPADLQLTLSATKALREEGHEVVDFVNRYYHKDGGWVHLKWYSRAVDGRILAVATDVSQEWERARLAEERTRLLQMAEKMAKVGHWRLRLSDNGLYWSEQVFRIHGRDPALGTPPLDQAVDYYHPDDRAKVGEYVRLAMEEGKSWEFELRLIDEQGQEHLVVSHGTAERDDTGRIVAVTGVFQDVTETRRLQRQLQEAERISSITTLAAGIAHELNNPLQYLSANVSMALESVRSVSSASKSPWAREQREFLEDASHAVDQVARIVQDLRVFMRPGDSSINERVDLGAVLATTISMTRAQVQLRADVSRSLLPIPQVMGDQAEFIQVFVNLVTNAADALRAVPPGTGRIRIMTRSDAHGNAIVEVEDNGPGVPAEIQHRVFDPFFTTKEVGEGTGLGLHVSRSIIQRRGGDIELVSRPGFTLFRVILPPAPEEQAPQAQQSALPTVLIVDDDPRVARTVARILRREYVCKLEHDPLNALRLIENGERFDVMLTDVNMPQLSGWDLVRRASEAWPELEHHVLMMTGANLGFHEGELDHLPMLRKPFKQEELLIAVEDRLAWLSE